MAEWRFALSRRWLGYLAMAVAFAIACVLLAAWQHARGQQAAAANAVIAANFDARPIALTRALPSLDSYHEDQKWRRVTASGRYLPDEQLLVRNRPLDGNPGFEVLTPFELDDGSVFVVDRGWVPRVEADTATDVPPPPDGEVRIVARLKPSEPRIGNQSAEGDTLASIRLGEAARHIHADRVYTGAYGLLESQSPAPADAPRPVVTSAPRVNEGLHISYMIQWVIFACIGFFGLGYAFRQEYRHRNGSDDAAVRPSRRRARKSDADIEDEILDAPLHRPS